MLGGLPTSGQYSFTRRRARYSFYRAPGFTVIEVMIVLAVTGLLFVSAAVLISGRQNRTAFEQSIRQVQSQIQQIINEVSIGYYPNLGNVRCSGVGNTVTLTNAAGTEQGANAGCIFMGKAVQFGVTGFDPEQFKVFSIAGLQKGGAGGAESATLSEARPKLIAPSSAEPLLPTATVTQQLQNGLTAQRMWYDNGGGERQIGVIAFTSSLAQYNSSTGAMLSGSQRVDVVPIDDNHVNSALGKSQLVAVDVTNARLAAATPNPSGGVFICFASGGTNQSGLITIGNNGRQLAVNVTLKSNKTCS